jgi:hypothetical protein
MDHEEVKLAECRCGSPVVGGELDGCELAVKLRTNSRDVQHSYNAYTYKSSTIVKNGVKSLPYEYCKKPEVYGTSCVVLIRLVGNAVLHWFTYLLAF